MGTLGTVRCCGITRTLLTLWPTRESWTYRQDRLPKEVVYQEVRFDFLTKQGYGSGVMQKDPQPMQLLGQAADLARASRRLN